jgi:hypothetical protein
MGQAMKVGESVKVPGVVCPFCDTRHDAASGVKASVGKRPKEGSLSICIIRSQISFYDGELQLRLPKPGELERGFAEDPKGAEDIRLLQRAIRMLPNRNVRK